ncbi:alpha/beta fold hydrolase [Sandarakinorhabdus sp. DWP1-3-1]|uniref:alpha/beta fold hydrolase n=1 Tax=Sandarakinorhabdus sp. DWP1-3-1 TaxID=2804627 RepID=UPI003CF6D1ED
MRAMIGLALLGLVAAPALARPAVPGSLVSAVPQAGAPRGSSGYLIRYASTDTAGRPIVVTGSLVVPEGRAPPRGRDVVVWAHGTTGVAEACALSTGPQRFANVAGLDALLARGLVVVIPDYQGLGNPGPHPYLVGTATAQVVIDAARAAVRQGGRQRGRFAVWGESQGGHAALWAAQAAARQAPELTLVGVAAAAPPTDLTANLTGGSNAVVRAMLTAYAGQSWAQVYGAPLRAFTGPVGADLIRRLATNCISLDGFKLRTKVGLVRLGGMLRGVDLGKVSPWDRLLRENSVPATGFPVPLLVAQGSKDEIVAPAVTRDFVLRACRAGATLRYVTDAGDHVTAGKRSAGVAVDWLAARFAGAPARNDCVRL